MVHGHRKGSLGLREGHFTDVRLRASDSAARGRSVIARTGHTGACTDRVIVHNSYCRAPQLPSTFRKHGLLTINHARGSFAGARPTIPRARPCGFSTIVELDW